MQNAEIEIITFDAKDVITTSSDAISFYVTSGLFDLREGWEYIGEQMWVNPDGNGSFGIGLGDGEDTCYTVSKGALYFYYFEDYEGNEDGMLLFERGIEIGKKGTLYSSLDAILGWLGSNATNIYQ